MLLFWMLLGGAAGVNVAQAIWRLLGWHTGNVAAAVPIGATAGAVAGALLALISRPSLLVLLMALFSGAAAGSVVGRLTWEGSGEIAGQSAGCLLGGVTWATWLYIERRQGRGW
jgi:hypothetical protein